MKFWTKILQLWKPIAFLTSFAGVVLFFDGVRDNVNSKFDNVIDTISGFREIIVNYQIENKELHNTEAEQRDEILRLIQNLQGTQRIIILKSNESQQILEEIKNQRLINESVDINYLENKEAYVVQLKKKELE